MLEISRRAAVGALGGMATAADPDTRPNTLVIVADDLRWDALGCTGHPFVQTPNIDRIAREGARFDNAFTTTPLSLLSRTTLLTGLYAHQHEVGGNDEPGSRSTSPVAFPLLQQKAGYATAFVGQWHRGTEDSPRPGFDRWISFKGQGQYLNPTFNIDAKAVSQTGYITDLLNTAVVDFIRRKRSKPFSLILSHKAIHDPFQPAERHRHLYDGMKPRYPASIHDSLEKKPVLRRTPPSSRAAAPVGDAVVRQQMQCLAAVDEGVGKILAALEETGQLDNTFLIFTSTNGYFWGEHGLWDKRAAYDEAIRVPLLIRYPRLIRAGVRLRNYVLNCDLAPTITEVSRTLPVPAMKGRSVVPLLQGRARSWRSSFLSEYYEERRSPRIPSWQAVRTDRWKYIRYTKLEGMDEFYDLAGDPLEMKNLISDASVSGALNDSKEELARLWRLTF